VQVFHLQLAAAIASLSLLQVAFLNFFPLRTPRVILILFAYQVLQVYSLFFLSQVLLLPLPFQVFTFRYLLQVFVVQLNHLKAH
jgi:hypothetical protein